MEGDFERFGEYELHERIAIGGMAEVFRAMRRGAVGFEQELAIKRILPGLADDEFSAMFIDEAKIAVRLSHPNVAQVYDLGRVDDQLYIALEYVRGRDMRRVADRIAERSGRAALPPAIAVHVAMCVARALHAAHTTENLGRPLGIIHRDVSPQNVLLSYEGEVKVIDFGLAKAAGRLTQTQAGVVKGKLAYLSSEQARGDEIDHRSDIFSLGTCLFEWLTGERLFLGKNDIETVMSVQKANVPSLRSLDKSLPLRLETLVMKALEPDPFMRFDTAQAMAEALERLAFDEAMIVTRGTLARFMAKLYQDEPPVARAAVAPQTSQAYELDDADLEMILEPDEPAEPAYEVPAPLPVEFAFDAEAASRFDAPDEPLPVYAEEAAAHHAEVRLEAAHESASAHEPAIPHEAVIPSGAAVRAAPPPGFRPSALPAGFRPSAMPGGPAVSDVDEAPLSPWHDEPAFEEATERRDTTPAPALEGALDGAIDDEVTQPPQPALPDPEIDFDEDTRVGLDLQEAEDPTAEHAVYARQPSLESTAPEDEWDEDVATRQVDLDDL